MLTADNHAIAIGCIKQILVSADLSSNATDITRCSHCKLQPWPANPKVGHSIRRNKRRHYQNRTYWYDGHGHNQKYEKGSNREHLIPISLNGCPVDSTKVVRSSKQQSSSIKIETRLTLCGGESILPQEVMCAVKKPPSKQEIRRRLEAQTNAFLKRGGEILAVPPGVSAVDEAISPVKTPIFTGPPQPRTPVNDIIETLDRRREAKIKRPASRRTSRQKTQRRKQIVYDDFGEPLRIIYRDD